MARIPVAWRLSSRWWRQQLLQQHTPTRLACTATTARSLSSRSRGFSSLSLVEELTIQRVSDKDSKLRDQPPKEALEFGTTFTDHMLLLNYDAPPPLPVNEYTTETTTKDQCSNKTGWHSPRIIPYQNLALSPASSGLHYGLQCFEGMKAYRALRPEKNDDHNHDHAAAAAAAAAANSIHLFRPDQNMKRFQHSMERLAFPGVDDLFAETTTKEASGTTTNTSTTTPLLQLIRALVRTDAAWIPYGAGYSLYIRPTVIATQATLGVAPPTSLVLFVIMSPVGPYYTPTTTTTTPTTTITPHRSTITTTMNEREDEDDEGNNSDTGAASTFFLEPIKLTADITDCVRAWPGGTGDVKVGGNYAMTMKTAADAAARGYSQILWHFGPNEEVTEVGAMNFFVYWIHPHTGRHELVTAPLSRHDILPGVTRSSILELCRHPSILRSNSTDDDDDDDTFADHDFDVSERFITMQDILLASQEDRLLEAFGAGTAAIVSPISHIQYQGDDILLPKSPGPLTTKIWKTIVGIQYRTIEYNDSHEENPNWIMEL